MKYGLSYIALSISLCNVSFASMQDMDSSENIKIGTVSVGGASNLDDLTSLLKKKAEREGGTSIKITSAGGNNKIYGTADVYK